METDLDLLHGGCCPVGRCGCRCATGRPGWGPGAATYTQRPGVASSTVQPPAVQPSGSPTVAPSATGTNPAARLADVVRTTPQFAPTDWVPARAAGSPLTATIPPTFTARFTAYNIITGSGQIQELAVLNPAAVARAPMPEGSTPPRGEVAIIVQLYPTGPVVPAQASTWPIIDSATLPLPLTGKPLEVTHFQNPEGGADVLIVRGKFTLPDGRVLDILGRTTSPESLDAVTTLINMALSIEVK